MRRIAKQYFLSVEGQTEKWYLTHLQHLINTSNTIQCKVHFEIKISRPLAAVKSWTLLGNRDILLHFQDYEDETEEAETKFRGIIDNIAQAKKIKSVGMYGLAYSNLSFELWLILHKCDMNSSVSDKKNYLAIINKMYGTKFQSLREIKEEKNFSDYILSKIGLDDIVSAINRADSIETMHHRNKDVEQEYRGYRYYQSNPALSIHKGMKQIFLDIGLLK